jgi:uncharacterized metal-binding protein YceD (DUF177 family)
MHAPGHRIALRDLVEEELLLALPIVPRHGGQECAPARSTDVQSEGATESTSRATGAAGAADAPDEKQRPFERLNELFKRVE